MPMTARERFLCALQGGCPDRVPWAEFYMSDELKTALDANTRCGAFPEAPLGMSAAVCFGPFFPRGFIEQRDGLRAGLLRTRADLDRMVFPDPGDAAFYEPAHRWLATAPADLAHGVATDLGAGAALQSMGIEGFAYALTDDPEFVAEVFRRYGQWSAEVHTRLCRMGFDFIWSGGDIAYKTAPFFSPNVFRERILPGLHPAADAITLPWIYHSDGNLTPILDDLLSLGMQGLHPFEPGAMDMMAIKARYAKRLCVVGNLDMDLLIRADANACAHACRALLRTFRSAGGYVLSSSNSLSHGVRPENVMAVSRVIRNQATEAKPVHG